MTTDVNDVEADDNMAAMAQEHGLAGIDEPENPLEPLSFDALPAVLREACERAGWQKLMPVQSLALPYLMKGRDIMVQSRTGSGKTGAFLLPCLERLDPSRNECQALVLTPTRELALQIEHEAEVLFEGTGLRSVAVYGGVGYGPQRDKLLQGAQLVVGTPGRVLDHLLNRNLNLGRLHMLILDEADRMLSIGFYPDMKAVQRYLPDKGVAVHLFSATYPAQVLRVAKEFMPKPSMLSLSHGQVHISSMEHLFYEVKPMEKDRALVRILEMESPSAAIIFSNTKANVHYITAVLRGFGYNADELSADLTQAQREQVLLKLRRGELRYLVATDVAARGIDIHDLSHVILYEPPEDHESYIHRAGRTGRAGAGGTVISLVDVMEKMELQRIAKHYKIDLQRRDLPDESALAAVVAERLTSVLEAKLRALSGLHRERFQRFVPLAKQLAEDVDSLSLVAMLLDEQYQSSLHARLEVPEERERDRSDKGGKNGRGKGRGRERSRHGGRDEERELRKNLESPYSNSIEKSDGVETAEKLNGDAISAIKNAVSSQAIDGTMPEEASAIAAENAVPQAETQGDKRKRKRRRRGRRGKGGVDALSNAAAFEVAVEAEPSERSAFSFSDEALAWKNAADDENADIVERKDAPVSTPVTGGQKNDRDPELPIRTSGERNRRSVRKAEAAPMATRDDAPRPVKASAAYSADYVFDGVKSADDPFLEDGALGGSIFGLPGHKPIAGKTTEKKASRGKSRIQKAKNVPDANESSQSEAVESAVDTPSAQKPVAAHDAGVETSEPKKPEKTFSRGRSAERKAATSKNVSIKAEKNVDADIPERLDVVLDMENEATSKSQKRAPRSKAQSRITKKATENATPDSDEVASSETPAVKTSAKRAASRKKSHDDGGTDDTGESVKKAGSRRIEKKTTSGKTTKKAGARSEKKSAPESE